MAAFTFLSEMIPQREPTNGAARMPSDLKTRLKRVFRSRRTGAASAQVAKRGRARESGPITGRAAPGWPDVIRAPILFPVSKNGASPRRLALATYSNVALTRAAWTALAAGCDRSASKSVRTVPTSLVGSVR
jgi:hypothetical protein